MNFFGHAALAASHFGHGEPAPSQRELSLLCAGAMLPDFVGMLRLGRPEVLDATLARGVAFHHQTDHAFHELSNFHSLSRHAFAELSEQGMPRGPARAVAHIGIEMLLDEVLADDAYARQQYMNALATPLDTALAFAAPADSERLAALRQTLWERAQGFQAPSPELLAQRIRRTLSGRPRLATDDAGEQLLSGWVTLTRPLVGRAAPALLAALRAQLADQHRPE